MPATILTAKGRELRDALEIVSSAVSRDHSRPMLTAILGWTRREAYCALRAMEQTLEAVALRDRALVDARADREVG